MEVGQYQILEVYNLVKQGAYLRDEEGDEVLLPQKYVPVGTTKGQKIEVFVYLDGQDRIIATTQQPKIEPFGFAFLECVDVAPFGAFVDWGLDRDLLVPNMEMERPMSPGKRYLVYLFIDEQDRPTGTTYINRCFANEDLDLKVGDKVDLMIYQHSQLGVKVIVNNTYDGLIFKDQVHQFLEVGSQKEGYIAKIRPENKLDISLQRFGYKKVLDSKDIVLQKLASAGGFLPLHDKSDSKEIQRQLEMSKKVFKKTIGGLYKDKKITIDPDGIRLI